MPHIPAERAPLNRTLTLSANELKKYSNKTLKLSVKADIKRIENRIINQNIFEVIDYLPNNFVDLMFIDPPYNLNKKFSTINFKEMLNDDYEYWIDSWLSKLVRTLKPDSSVYFCCDWKTSIPTYNILKKYFIIRNRITWEREKGRGAKSNWKNCYEDIWYCTMSNKFTFNIESVKLKRRVRAPYKTVNGDPKDWKSENGSNYRITYPSNLWTDITIPFWSMPENTDHPTQKPEKLLAKIILASSNKNDLIFDPFLGSGTSIVTAKKLGRNYCGIELDKTYASIALKRLEIAEKETSIQGYNDGVFWERNTLLDQKKKAQ
jgi:site-specific DNA-methyltransferase (adenine-specific)